MNELKDRFLQLAVIEQKKYSDIAKLLETDNKTLSKLWDENKVEREYLASLKKKWQSKCNSTSFYEFKSWYEKTPKQCNYCGINEAEINQLFNSGNLFTKRTRGKTLEIDRKEPNLKYDKLDNLVLSCYWCNNAKTDTFTSDEFIEIGKAIKTVWQKRLAK